MIKERHGEQSERKRSVDILDSRATAAVGRAGKRVCDDRAVKNNAGGRQENTEGTGWFGARWDETRKQRVNM